MSTIERIPFDRAAALIVNEMLVRDRRDYDPGRCAAWMGSKQHICGKPRGKCPYLCDLHYRVGKNRQAKRKEKEAARLEKLRADVEAQRPKLEARLATIEKRLDKIDPLRNVSDRDHEDWHAQVNLPLSKRLPSGSRLSELAALHDERDYLLAKLGVKSEHPTT